MRITDDQYYLNIVSEVRKKATCIRRQVGCVLVDHRGHILSTGYNGVATGQPHCNHTEERATISKFVSPTIREELESTFGSLVANKDYWEKNGVKVREIRPHACDGAFAESGKDLDKCEAIHAEQNALLQCQSVWAIETAYVTTAPCITCTKLLLNTGTMRIVFLEDYPHSEAARKLWESAGKEWIKWEE